MTVTSEQGKRTFGTYLTRVIKTEDLTPRVKGISFQLEEGNSMTFKPGQFVQMYIPHEGKEQRTSYSIASPPFDPQRFDLCVTRVEGGVSSNFLHSMKVGDTIKAMGPLGRFTLPESLERDPVFIATGSGIAPFRSMILEILKKKQDRRIYLVFGNRFEEDIIYRNEWEKLKKDHPEFRSLMTLSRPTDSWTGPKGYVQDKITELVPDLSEKDFYICGLVKMINGVSEKLESLGVAKERIHFERYD